ncbi:putative ABC transporter ATP-binding protein YheS [subsurface metagenome]
MPLVTLTEVSLSFGTLNLLKAVNFSLSQRQKVALIGANGSGKSTLMRIIAGEVKADSGTVKREKNIRISYLAQSGIKHTNRTLYEEVEQSFRGEALLHDELRGVEAQLGEHREDSAEARRLLRQYAEFQSRLQDSAYERRREIIERVLQGLMFSRDQFTHQVSQFSEGWQMRIALARILCERPDILLLDEPTNYLDLEARNWLESYIREFPGGVLLVSHDRFFLDTTIDSVLELYLGKAKLYPGSFSRYERRRVAEMEQLSRAYLQQQEEILRIERFIRRFRFNASKARLVQSRVKQLERMERIEPPPSLKSMHFSFSDPPHSGKLSLKLKGIGKCYGEKRVFDKVDLELSRGDRLVLLGVNGAGKSTLMRIMAGVEEPGEGRLSYGSGVSTGYFSADQLDASGFGAGGDVEKTGSVIEAIEAWAPTALVPHLRNLLGAFLFRGDEIHKPVAVLSGGERCRLALIKLLLKPANLLFLDEPTSHLDINSKDVLLEAMSRYPGSLVFVSHDRYFIEKLATRVLELEQGKATLYYGDYSYYLWRKEQAATGSDETKFKPAQARKEGRKPENGSGRFPIATSGVEGLSNKQARLVEKTRKSTLRRLQREEADLMAEIECLQTESVELEQAMSREEVYLNGEKMKQIRENLAHTEKLQEELQARWEALEEEQRTLD